MKMKKLINLSMKDIEYVYTIAKDVSDPRAKRGNFSKALSKIINEYRMENEN